MNKEKIVLLHDKIYQLLDENNYVIFQGSLGEINTFIQLRERGLIWIKNLGKVINNRSKLINFTVIILYGKILM